MIIRRKLAVLEENLKCYYFDAFQKHLTIAKTKTP